MSSARRTKLSATRSTPISSPVCTCLRSSSGTAGSAAASPGMLRPWREATAPPISTSASISPSPGRVAVTRSRTAPSARYMISSLWTLSASPAQVIDIRCASPSKPLAPQTKVRWSPGLSSAIPSASGPIRSLGPGRSCRIATCRPARPAASRTSLAVSACSSAVPCEKFSRATSMPASIRRTSTSGSREAGPIVATILVRRIETAHGSGCAAWTMSGGPARGLAVGAGALSPRARPRPRARAGGRSRPAVGRAWRRCWRRASRRRSA